MRNIPNHIVLLFFCLITISCERERVYPFKHQSPLLSLHAIIEAGEVLEVKLAQTTNLTRSQEGGQLISTASFIIQWNEDVYQYDSLYSNNGIYVFPEINPKEGDRLALVAQSGNMEAKGEIRIPSRSLTQLKGVEVDESNLNPLVTVHLNLAESDLTTGPFMIYATGLLQDPQTGQIEKKRFKEAEEYISALEKDINFPKSLQSELQATIAHKAILEKDYQKAITALKKAEEKTRSKYFFILDFLSSNSANSVRAFVTMASLKPLWFSSSKTNGTSG